jgi:hypothetical protein
MDQNRTVTATFSPDSDGDGISDAIEDTAPGGGDADGDGNLDRFERNVATFRSIYGDYITLVSQPGTTLANVVFQGNPSPGEAPAEASFGFGFFSFILSEIAPGASATVTAILHTKKTCTSYYRYGPTPDNAANHWYLFLHNGQTGAIFSEQGGKAMITLHLKDGELGDDDLSKNGAIVDAGGPQTADMIDAATPSGGGGGCFIRAITE